MRVLGIDPGFGRCGVAVLEGGQTQHALLYSSCIETTPTQTFTERLHEVGSEIVRLIETYSPDTIAIEELYFTNNAKTALRVSEVRGMIMYIAMVHGIHIVEYNPLAIKIALTGYGRATKEQVTKMVETIISFEKKPTHDDEYDAVAVSLTALAHERFHKRQ